MTRSTTTRPQQLYPHQALDRMLCRRCNDGTHKLCERGDCQCPCLDPRKPLPRIERDRNGLSQEQREAQHSFPFDDFGSTKV